MTTPEPILRVRGLSKTYNQKKAIETWVRALQDVSLEVFPGEFVAVAGVSGSGKSTLMHCIGSFEEVDPESRNAIQYRRDGEFHDLGKDPSWYRQNFIGVIFQAFHLLPNLRVCQNVDVPLRLRKCQKYAPGLPERRAAVRDVLHQLGIDELSEKRINKISGGECQRVAIARALIKRPRLLIADEPTGNLDVKTTREIVTILRDVTREGVAVLMVTHNVDIAREFADRIVTLSDGRVTNDERIARAPVESPEVGASRGQDQNESAPGMDVDVGGGRRTLSDETSGLVTEHPDELGSLSPVKEVERLDGEPDSRSVLRDTGLPEEPHETRESHEYLRAVSSERSAEGPPDSPFPDGPTPSFDQGHRDSDVCDEAPTAAGEAAAASSRQMPPISDPLVKSEAASPVAGGAVGTDEDAVETNRELSAQPSVGRRGEIEIEANEQTAEQSIEDTQRDPRRPPTGDSLLAKVSRGIRRIRFPGCDMGLWDLTGFALRDAKESSVSLFANVVAILFGTVLTALLLSLVFGAERYMTSQLAKIPQIDTVSVWVDYSTGAEPISEQDYEQLKQWSHVTRVLPDIKQMAWLYKRAARQPVVAFASAVEDDPATKRFELIKGTVDVDPDGWEIVIPERVAYELDNFDPHGLVGETVTLELRRYAMGSGVEEDSTPTRTVMYPVRVVGIVKTTPYDRVYASLNMVRFVRDFGTMRSDYTPDPGSKIDLAMISARTMNEAVRLHFANPAQAEKAFQDMRATITQRFDVHWPGEEYLYLRDVQLVAFLVFLGIGVLTIAAGSVSIFNTLQASVLRKTREIGILRALGLNRFSIFSVYMSQSVFVAVLAGFAGMGLSALAVNAANPAIAEHWKLQDVQTLLILPLSTMLWIVGVVICICAAAALIPAWRAAQRTPMDAIREAAS